MATNESTEVVKHAMQLARAAGINKLLVQVNGEGVYKHISKIRGDEHVVWLLPEEITASPPESKQDFCVEIPDCRLTRMSQIHLGLFLSLLQQYIERDEVVVCLSGDSGTERLDTIHVTSAKRDFPWFQGFQDVGQKSRVVNREFARILSIALRLATEGREGRPVGTTFILGDESHLDRYVRQLVLNPCKGHSRKVRSIHDSQFFETIREFAALDGAFIVSRRGIVESAGAYIDAPARRTKLRSGWGARHTSAAALTATTKSVAVVLSESSGTVTVFHGGKAVLELERLARSRE